MIRSILMAIAANFLALGSNVAFAQEQQCRDVTIDGAVQRLCRGADGAWRPAPAPSLDSGDVIASGVIPASFRGRATYRGPFDAQVTDAPRGRRQGGLGGLLSTAIGGTSRQITGVYTITLNFEPNGIVTGNASGTNLPVDVTLSGTRQGDQCRLTAAPGGSTFEGTCTPTLFRGLVTSSPAETRGRFRISFDLAASEFVDAAEEAAIRARAAAEAAERDRVARAEQERTDSARRARLISAANGGDIDAMEQLGNAYFRGSAASNTPGGFAIDYVEARRWFERAASRGSVFANGKLGAMYGDGLGVSQSEAQAFRYQLACAQGRPADEGDRAMQANCMAIVALRYEAARGVVRNDAEAVRWYRACAAAGDDYCINWMNEHGVR